MKDFDRWFEDSTKQYEYKPQAGDPTFDGPIHFFVECRRCGKQACISYTDLTSGDSGWYVDEPEQIEEMETSMGLCGSGPGCTP